MHTRGVCIADFAERKNLYQNLCKIRRGNFKKKFKKNTRVPNCHFYSLWSLFASLPILYPIFIKISTLILVKNKVKKKVRTLCNIFHGFNLFILLFFCASARNVFLFTASLSRVWLATLFGPLVRGASTFLCHKLGAGLSCCCCCGHNISTHTAATAYYFLIRFTNAFI